MSVPDSAPTAASVAKCLLRTRPVDHLLALSTASARLPLIGPHLEPLGATTAMGVWGSRNLPHFVSAAARARLTPGAGKRRRRDRDQTTAVTVAALRGIVDDVDLDIAWPAPRRTPPLWDALDQRRHLYRQSLRYGSDPAQVLDVWRRKDLPAQPAPVLIFAPGGAWVHGSRAMQGYALLSHLAERGWVCLSIDYRVAPQHRWPAHIIDVKTAIAWAHANVDKFGGDRDFVAVAGASAGGHLAALAGLTGATGRDPDYADDLPPGADTSVDAVIGLYGRYDWTDRSTTERREFVDFLQRVVVGRSIRRRPEVFAAASPIDRLHPQAPPFLIVHGSADTVIPVAQARDFAARLRAVSESAVGYLELPGAGHVFDLMDGARTDTVTTAIGLFLDRVHRDRAAAATQRVV